MSKYIIIAVRWFAGGVFLLFAMALATTSVVAIASLIAGVLLLPPLSKKFPKFMDKKLKIGVLVICTVLTFYGLGKLPQPEQTPPTLTPEESSATEETTSEDPTYKVTKIIDGDTVAVTSQDQTLVTLRIIGIDTPERNECYFDEASKKAEELLLDKTVQLETDESQDEKDKYDRTLVYIILPTGENFGEIMIKEGFAKEYTYDNSYKYQTLYKDAESVAKTGKLGLWSACETQAETKTVETETTTPIKSETAPQSSTPSSTITPSISTNSTTSNSTSSPSSSSSAYSCATEKTCGQMSSCEEAYYHLNDCGYSERDADQDGVPCETLCN